MSHEQELAFKINNAKQLFAITIAHNINRLKYMTQFNDWLWIFQ